MSSSPASTPPPAAPPAGFLEFVQGSQAQLEQINTQIQDLTREIEQPPPNLFGSPEMSQIPELVAARTSPPEIAGEISDGGGWGRKAGQELADQVVDEVLENGAESLLKQAARKLGKSPSRTRKPRQWFLGSETGASAPIPESELLRLLEEGALPWNTLVWHRSLQDWTPADETELADLARPATPPPLPGKGKTQQPQVHHAQACHACGKLVNPEDSFCPLCGAALETK